MVAMILNKGRIEYQVASNLALNSRGPLLNISKFQRAGIDRDHTVAREIGILSDVDRMPGISAVPVKRREHLVIQHEARVESVGNPAVGIQIQRNVKHTE